MPPRKQRSQSAIAFLRSQKTNQSSVGSGRPASNSVGSKPHDQSPFVNTPTISEKSYSVGEEKVITAVFAGFLNQWSIAVSIAVQLEAKPHGQLGSTQLMAQCIQFIQKEGLISTRLDSSGKPESMGELLTRTASIQQVKSAQGNSESVAPERKSKENPPSLHLTAVLELVNNYEAYLKTTTSKLDNYSFVLKPAWEVLSQGLSMIEHELSSGEMTPLDTDNKQSFDELKKRCSEKIPAPKKDDTNQPSPRSFNKPEDERNRCLPTTQAAQSLQAMASKFSPTGQLSNPFNTEYTTELYQRPMTSWMRELSNIWGINEPLRATQTNTPKMTEAPAQATTNTKELLAQAFSDRYNQVKENRKGVPFLKFGNKCESFESIVYHAAGLNRRGLLNTGLRSANILMNLFEEKDQPEVKEILAEMRKNRNRDLSQNHTQLINLYANSVTSQARDGNSTAHNSAHLHASHNSNHDASPAQLRASALQSHSQNSNGLMP